MNCFQKFIVHHGLTRESCLSHVWALPLAILFRGRLAFFLTHHHSKWPIKNEAYFPHSSSQNWHQQIRWSRALDTPILSSPPPRHRRRVSLIFHLSNSQHSFDRVYTLRSVTYLTNPYAPVWLLSLQNSWNKLWFVTCYISVIFNLTTSIILIEIGDRSFRGVDYLIVTGIYDSRWRASLRSRLSVSGRKFTINIKKNRLFQSLLVERWKFNRNFFFKILLMTSKHRGRWKICFVTYFCTTGACIYLVPCFWLDVIFLKFYNTARKQKRR